MIHSAIHRLLFDKLMEGANEQTGGDALGLAVFRESTHMDIAKIEPAILDLLARRDEELRTKMICGHPLVLMTLVPFAEQPAGAVMPTENEHFKLIDPKKLAYRCSACEREKQFVRALVEHARKRMPTASLVEEEVLAQGRAATA